MNLRVEQDGRVRRLTLAAPARRNILDAALAAQLLNELRDAQAHPDTGAILVDAEGPVFCGGLDFTQPVPDEIFTFGGSSSKPIVMAMQGVAVSAGVALIANAHVAIVAQGSSFGLTDIREGRCHPGILGAVAAAIGDRRARELSLTGRVFTAPEALAWGLVHAITPPFELDDRASAVAKALGNADSSAVSTILAFSRATAD
ncbi:MAG: enoyl-CoA hydratase/isomerase family protein [Acidobacteriia bacterium]|nr:enoyl-CoA hydratase/isomerase family protein [Terriglobia bacterium]